MSRYVTLFEDASIGVQPAGWTARMNAAANPSKHTLAGVLYPGHVIKRKGLLYTQTPQETLGMYSYDAPDEEYGVNASAYNIEVLTMMRAPTVDAGTFRVWARADGDGGRTGFANSGYAAELDFVNNRVRLLFVLSGAETELGRATVNLARDTNYYVRFRCFDGVGQVEPKVRVWAYGTAESASSWTVGDGSPTPASTGFVLTPGLVGFGWTAAAGPAATQCYVHFFSVGTQNADGTVDTPFNPMTDAEYLAWLNDQTQLRCVIGDLKYNGYNADAATDLMVDAAEYVSDTGYATHPYDDPPNQLYRPCIDQIPTFSRLMNTALGGGEVPSGFGALRIKNPVSVAGGAGDRDDWTRRRWKRDFVKLYFGGPTWSKHDFRTFVVGRLGQCIAPDDNVIEFPLEDLTGKLDVPLLSNKLSSTGLFKPKVLGRVAWYDVPVLDATARTYQLSDGPISKKLLPLGYMTPLIFDGGVPLFRDGSGVGAPERQFNYYSGSSTLELAGSPTPAHGYLNGYMVMFPSLFGGSGTLPAELSQDINYYVVNKTATTFQLSATAGGSPIVFSSSGTTNALQYVYFYTIDFTTGVLTLLANSATGRITAKDVQQADVNDITDAYLTIMLKYVMFTMAGISLDYQDTDTFTAAQAALIAAVGGTSLADGYFIDGKSQVSARDVVNAITQKSYIMWYGAAPEGLLQIGLLDLPTATSVQDFIISDVKDKSLKLLNVLRPIDFNTTGKSLITQRPTYLDSALQAQLTYLSQFGTVREQTVAITPSTTTPPIDHYAALNDVREPAPVFNTIAHSNLSCFQLANLFRYMLGVYEFYTRLSAMRLNIGDTISLTYPRMGWKTWSAADPASPDNTATLDSTKAVVIGIDVDLSRDGPFKVKLTVFRRIPSSFPQSYPLSSFSLEENNTRMLREDGTYEFEEY